MTKTADYKISLEELLEAGCHFGHQARRWNPKMKPYIYTKREGVHILDLAKTAEKLAEAMKFVRELTKTGRTLVFVGTKRQASAVIKEEANRAGMPYVATRWLGGIITNWEQVEKSIKKMTEFENRKSSGELNKYTKKERLLLEREIERSRRFLGGLSGLKELPGAIFVTDIKKEIVAVQEARKKGLPVVAIVDTNTDPDLADYPIPANDDAVSSIKYITTKIAQAAIDGKSLCQKSA